MYAFQIIVTNTTNFHDLYDISEIVVASNDLFNTLLNYPCLSFNVKMTSS